VRRTGLARILVVDDSAFVTTQLSQILVKGGHTIAAVAVSGDDAIACLEARADQIDLVTLDITMPGTSGVDTLRHIRMHWPQMLCVVVSGIGKKETVLEVRELGAAGYIIKPLQRERVLEKISEVLAESGVVS